MVQSREYLGGDAVAEIGSTNKFNTKKDIQLEQGECKEVRTAGNRGRKLPLGDRPRVEYLHYEQHEIRSCPDTSPHGWMVSFIITCPDHSFFLSLPLPLEDVKPTIEEAHQVGFAMARAIISNHPCKNLQDFTESERDAIKQLRCRLEVKRLANKLDRL